MGGPREEQEGVVKYYKLVIIGTERFFCSFLKGFDMKAEVKGQYPLNKIVRNFLVPSYNMPFIIIFSLC